MSLLLTNYKHWVSYLIPTDSIKLLNGEKNTYMQACEDYLQSKVHKVLAQGPTDSLSI